jgi:hypothetical protein
MTTARGFVADTCVSYKPVLEHYVWYFSPMSARLARPIRSRNALQLPGNGHDSGWLRDVMTQIIIRSGVGESIRTASTSALACRGFIGPMPPYHCKSVAGTS